MSCFCQSLAVSFVIFFKIPFLLNARGMPLHNPHLLLTLGEPTVCMHLGPDSNLTTRGDRTSHPVVHVSYNDALAFCSWSVKVCQVLSPYVRQCGNVGRYLNSFGVLSKEFPQAPTFSPAIQRDLPTKILSQAVAVAVTLSAHVVSTRCQHTLPARVFFPLICFTVSTNERCTECYSHVKRT